MGGSVHRGKHGSQPGGLGGAPQVGMFRGEHCDKNRAEGKAVERPRLAGAPGHGEEVQEWDTALPTGKHPARVGMAGRRQSTRVYPRGHRKNGKRGSVPRVIARCARRDEGVISGRGAARDD